MAGLDLLPPEHRQLLVGGTWRAASEGATFDVIDPADGSVLTAVADATVADAVEALDAAAEAQPAGAGRRRANAARSCGPPSSWSPTRADALAELMSLEMGKPVKEAKGEVAYGNEFFRWYAEEAVRIHGRWMQAPAGGSRLLTIKKPVGPCLFVTPWNFPLAMGTRKIGPAVAAGCTMVVKPAGQTPLTMLALAAILEEAGLPAGVLNVITTSRSGEVSEALQADDRLRKVSFTGSTGVGRVMVRQSAEQLQRVSMELGGNAPFLVFDDADLDAAVDGAMIAKMRNMGEACTAANRFLVHVSVADEFAARLADRMAALTVGRGQDEGVDVGSADRREGRRVRGPAGHRRRARRRQGARRRRDPGRTRVLLPADGAGRRTRRLGDQPRGDLRPGRADHDLRVRGRGDRDRPTTPSTAWPPTSTPATWSGPSGWRSRWSSAWSASTPAWSPTPRRRSAA